MPRLTLFDQWMRAQVPSTLTPTRCIRATEDHLRAANESGDLTSVDPAQIDREFAIREFHDDEVRSGLESLPTARQEREDPERWNDGMDEARGW